MSPGCRFEPHSLTRSFIHSFIHSLNEQIGLHASRLAGMDMRKDSNTNNNNFLHS